MSRLAAFWRLPVADQRRLVAAAVLLVVLRAALAVGSLAQARRVARVGARIAPRRSESPERVAWAVVVAGRQLPASCLYEALAAEALLARAGYEGRIHVGVAPAETFEAHAWVTVDGAVLVGEHADLDRFEPLPLAEAF